jgi:hypothetical protein
VKEKYRHKLVIVKWIDSRGASARWQFLEDKNELPVECISVGWIVKENKNYKTIVPHLSIESDLRQGCGDMVIPTRAIKSIPRIAIQPIRL